MAALFAGMKDLIEKYNVAGPRYTSYPTVPHWDNSTHDEESWKSALISGLWKSGKEVSLYIHLPFCESLCTYCGCTTRITKDHSVEEKYIRYLLKEWDLYLAALPCKPILKEIHLGGGTPTFFSPENLKLLITGITESVEFSGSFEFGFEGHPGNTTENHLKTLFDLGFTRISLGIQDFDPEVQKTTNRKQTFEQVRFVTETARNLGFTSINFDLIYGLPKQTPLSTLDTLSKTIKLAPTRIAYYGYAHVPWIKPAQKSFEEFLPTPDQRLKMYTVGKKILAHAGYHDIGMDHFAIKEDSLYKALIKGGLHRNFMGYTTQTSNLLIGLGMSAISDSWTAFSQNEKTLSKYYKKLDNNRFPIVNGHQLTYEDLQVRKHILNLMCTFQTTWDEDQLLKNGLSYNLELLDALKKDRLINWNETGIQVLEAGRPFIRNICMALDARLWRAKTYSGFSKII